MQRKTLWRKKLWNDLAIGIPKTNIHQNLDMQISLQLKDSSSKPQQMFGLT